VRDDVTCDPNRTIRPWRNEPTRPRVGHRDIKPSNVPQAGDPIGPDCPIGTPVWVEGVQEGRELFFRTYTTTGPILRPSGFYAVAIQKADFPVPYWVPIWCVRHAAWMPTPERPYAGRVIAGLIATLGAIEGGSRVICGGPMAPYRGGIRLILAVLAGAMWVTGYFAWSEWRKPFGWRDSWIALLRGQMSIDTGAAIRTTLWVAFFAWLFW
jgi:hypothetical protein